MWCMAGRFRRAPFIVFRVLLLASLASLASCVQPTVFPRYLTVADVINNVKCELYLAIGETIWKNPKSTWLDPWTAKFSVVLQVKRQTVGNADFTFVVPYNAPVGLFTLVVGGSVDKSGQSRMAFDFSADKNLKTFRSKDQCAYWQQLKSRNNLAGETGLRLWFGNVIEGFNQARVKSTSLTYTLQFVTTIDGHIKPSFKSTYPSKKIFAGEFGITRKRTDDNTLTIVFSPPATAFAATDLGKVLARIELQLGKLEAERSMLKTEVKKNEAKVEAFRQSFAPTDQDRKDMVAARSAAEVGREKIRVIDESVAAFESQKRAVQADIAAARRAAAGATEQQLDQLLLIDAIRDIPRR